MSPPPLKQLVDEVLIATPFYSLATTDNTNLWSCTLWFANDKDYNFYFISKPDSKHMQNLAINPTISMSLFHPKAAEEGSAVGIQLTGTAEILTNDVYIQNAYEIYFGKQNPETGKDAHGRTIEDFLTGKTPWKFVTIRPSEIWYFDNRFFEEDRQKFR